MQTPHPEFSRIINVSRLSPKGVEDIFEAKPSERAALAERFDLIDLLSVQARLTLIPGDRHTVKATGTLEAKLVQRCVMTLEPIEKQIKIDIDILFVPEEKAPSMAEGQALDDLEDEFECFSNGKIDIGETIAQQLGVNIDPYPRKPDATLTKTEFGAKEEKTLPFAHLKSAVAAKKNKDK